MKARSLIAALALFFFAAIVFVGDRYGAFHVPAVATAVVRWLAIAALIFYAGAKRSLTTWILVSMVVGAEIGHDFPHVAVNLRILSLIFLRLIKTIIAPLLFGTLVVGIAGHHDLKQVGRMGIKALIYFEVVTTIALFIGLGAINLSKAGVGVNAPPALHAELPPAVKQTATDIILHAFPENIAKSIAEGQVLQIVVFSIIFGIALSVVYTRSTSCSA